MPSTRLRSTLRRLAMTLPPWRWSWRTAPPSSLKVFTWSSGAGTSDPHPPPMRPFLPPHGGGAEAPVIMPSLATWVALEYELGKACHDYESDGEGQDGCAGMEQRMRHQGGKDESGEEGDRQGIKEIDDLLGLGFTIGSGPACEKRRLGAQGEPQGSAGEQADGQGGRRHLRKTNP